MKHKIPAKTFLVGEYVALTGGPAIVLTTNPCFEIEINPPVQALEAFHPDSPAGQFILQNALNINYTWKDPYQSIGGLGASSAQFLGMYLAQLEDALTQDKLLNAYWQVSHTNAQAKRPSGYDVLAQASSGCVYLNHQAGVYQSYTWLFSDIDFVLVHTGTKLATHHHLEALTIDLDSVSKTLTPIAQSAKAAFDTHDSTLLIQAVNQYAKALASFNLVQESSAEKLKMLSEHDEVLAAKGCGALGADVLLLLAPKSQVESLKNRLVSNDYRVLATSESLYLPKKTEDLLFSP